LRLLNRFHPNLFPENFAGLPVSDWGTGTDASPTFTPGGKTVYFTHAEGEKRTIMVSHFRHGAWSKAQIAPFSGTWRDIEPAMAPDGSYLVFISNRPKAERGPVLDGFFGGEIRPGKGGNLWRVDRVGKGWRKPIRLPDTVNVSSATYGPAVARNGDIYFSRPDPVTKKTRMYWSRFIAHTYEAPQPLSFTDGVMSHYDPAVAPDESFIIFSSNRPPSPKSESGIFVAFSDGHGWQTPVALEPFLLGIECRLSPNLKTLYFTADKPTLDASPPAQNGLTSVSAAPQRIWQISLKGLASLLHDRP
jgi:Tol biopolymer transport system component